MLKQGVVTSKIFVLTENLEGYINSTMKLLTTPEVAERLGITIARVQQLIWGGRLPAQKIGRDYVIQEDDLKLVVERKPGRPRKESEPQAKRKTKGKLK